MVRYILQDNGPERHTFLIACPRNTKVYCLLTGTNMCLSCPSYSWHLVSFSLLTMTQLAHACYVAAPKPQMPGQIAR